MKIKLEKDQEEKLREAFRCITALCCAEVRDNHSTCGSFHIEPFNTHWDTATVQEVMSAVQLYVRTWIQHPLQETLGLSPTQEEMKMMINWHKSQAHILEKQLK